MVVIIINIEILKTLILKPITFKGIIFEILDVSIASHQSTWTCQTHMHPWYEFNYVKKGNLTNIVNSKEFDIKSGECMLMSPGVTHSHFHKNDIGDYGVCIRFHIKKSGEENALFDNLSQILQKEKPFSFKCNLNPLFNAKTPISAQSAVVSWILSMYDLWHEETFVPQKNASNIPIQVMMYLNEYYMNKIYVQDIAKALNVSYRNLARTFKKEFNVGIIEKLNEIRTNKAKKLLITTDYTMSEIAELVGFENEFYFSTAFKKYAYVTPSKFRRDK